MDAITYVNDELGTALYKTGNESVRNIRIIDDQTARPVSDSFVNFLSSRYRVTGRCRQDLFLISCQL